MLLASFAAVVAVLIYLPSFGFVAMRLYGGDSVDIPHGRRAGAALD